MAIYKVLCEGEDECNSQDGGHFSGTSFVDVEAIFEKCVMWSIIMTWSKSLLNLKPYSFRIIAVYTISAIRCVTRVKKYLIGLS